MPWSDALTHEVVLRRPALSPSALEDQVAAFTERHRARMAGLDLAEEACEGLREALQEAMDASHEALRETRPRPLGRLTRLFVEVPSPPLLSETLWTHHERAQRRVRALAHHAQAVERDLVLLEQDLQELAELALDCARDAETSGGHAAALEAGRIRLGAALKRTQGSEALALQLELDRLEALLGERQRQRRAYAHAEARFRALAGVQRSLREVLGSMHGHLLRLHAAGATALERLSRNATELQNRARSRDLERLQALAVDDLDLAVGQALGLDGGVAQKLDDLEQRMRALDREAEARRLALLEIEDALARGTT